MRKIACVDFKGDTAIKSVRFDGLRKIGCPVELSQKYCDMGIDEIYLHDATSSLYGTGINFELVRRVANSINIPLTVSGGVKTIDDCGALLEAGADRVSINSAFVDNIKLAENIVALFGSQFLSTTIEYRVFDEENVQLFYRYGRETINFDLISYSKRLSDQGIGELVYRCITRDGVFAGVHTEIIDHLPCVSHLQIVLLGGAIKSDLNLNEKGLNGIAIGSSLHFGRITEADLK
ncbi:HisA/HisF-related TIM barrel protein [Paracoccaceae bacterium]|nr:HisA/HisF-related TIM barrel protein [Paracoccaceae bacterium]